MAVSWTSGLSTVAVKQFEAEFLLACQQLDRKFAGKIQEVRGVVGGDYRMKMALNWTMRDRGSYHSVVAQTIPDYREIVISPTEKVANIPSDIFEQALVNSSEVRIQARNAVASLNRSQDQIVIDCFDTAQDDMESVEATSNLTVDALIDARKKLAANNCPDDNLYFFGHVNQMASLLKDSDAASSDYNSTRILNNGMIDSYVGFKFIWFGDMDEGGVTLDTSIRDCYAFHMDAAKAAWWIDPSVKISQKDESFSSLILPRFMMGATIVDPDKSVLVQCTES